MRSPDSIEISENCFWIIRIWEETVSTSYNRMPRLWRYPSHRIGSKGTWVTEEAFSGSGKIREITIDINMMTSPLPLLFSQYITFSLLPVFPPGRSSLSRPHHKLQGCLWAEGSSLSRSTWLSVPQTHNVG